MSTIVHIEVSAAYVQTGTSQNCLALLVIAVVAGGRI